MVAAEEVAAVVVAEAAVVAVAEVVAVASRAILRTYRIKPIASPRALKPPWRILNRLWRTAS